MHTYKNTVVVINAKSRKSRRSIDAVKKQLNKHGIEPDSMFIVTDSDSFSEAVETIQNTPPGLLIIGGGDGTIQSLISQIQRDKTVVAILPLGTVNNFARSLGVHKDISSAVKAIAAGRQKEIHLGDINGHLFTNLSAIGISVRVAQNISDTSKRFLGRMVYYLQGIYEVAIHKPFLCELTVDEKPTQRFYTHQIVVANGRYNGAIRLTAGERVESGHLTAIIFGRNKRRLAHIKSILYFIFPQWVRVQPVALRGEKIRIVTDPARAVEVDGEAVSQTPATYTLVEHGLTVIYRSKQS